MFHKITSLATLPDYILLVGFANGEFKQFDLKPLINKYPPFATLKDVDGSSGTTTSIFPRKAFMKKGFSAHPRTILKNTGKAFLQNS